MKKGKVLTSGLMALVLTISCIACTEESKLPSGGDFTFGGNYLSANEFSEGLALVKDENGLAYIGVDGAIAYRPNVAAAGNYSEGKAWYRLADGMGGYMDKSGKRVGELINAFGTTGADDYKNGLACVTSDRKSVV